MSLALVTARITALSSSTAQSPRGLCVSPLNEAIRVGWSVEDAPSALKGPALLSAPCVTYAGFQIFDLHTGGAR
jgi:hypothetical protein